MLFKSKLDVGLTLEDNGCRIFNVPKVGNKCITGCMFQMELAPARSCRNCIFDHSIDYKKLKKVRKKLNQNRTSIEVCEKY